MLKHFLPALLCLVIISCSPRIQPEKPLLTQTNFNLDSVPLSEINIPVQVSLKPIFAMAERRVDTVFTSPDYPNGWVHAGCDMRYKYTFRRSPLRISAIGNSFDLGFTGYYRIIGSTRVCVMGAAVSPWSSPCRCGFDEGERSVDVSFSNSISLQRDYRIRLQTKRNDPVPLDKCEVCFWGQDITKQVMKGLTEELDLAKTELDRNYGTVDMRQPFQQLWNELNKAYNIYDLGWMQINPQRIHVNNLYASGDSLYVYLGLSAKPVISFERPLDKESPVPPISEFNPRQGFSVFLDAVLDYDSLSQILNEQLVDMEFDLNKGPVKKKFIIKNCKVYGEGNEKLIIKVDFAGTNKGEFYLTGKPVFNKETKVLEVANLDFDIRSKNALLKTAEWLFSRRITNEIARYTRYDLSTYIDTAKTMVNEQLNREWIHGVHSIGNIDDITIESIYPFSRHLVIRSNCTGTLSVKVDSIDFSL